jgi:hypothetical protein
MLLVYVYSKGRNLLGESLRRKDCIKMDVKDVGCQGVDWIHLVLRRR